jgi:hypothetical protein
VIELRSGTISVDYSARKRRLIAMTSDQERTPCPSPPCGHVGVNFLFQFLHSSSFLSIELWKAHVALFTTLMDFDSPDSLQ